MVHGVALLVRHVLALKRPIDKFDHLMDIMKSCRHELQLIENSQKIVVFDGYLLNKRFDLLPGSRDVFNAYSEMEQCNRKAHLDSPPRGSFDKCRWSYEYQRTTGDINGWYDVFLYSTRKFTMLEDIARFDEEEWLELKKQTEVDPDLLHQRKYVEMSCAARFAHMHKKPEYWAKVKEHEAAATAVPLTAEEQNVLECVRNAPQLEGIIAHEGFEMYTEHY